MAENKVEIVVSVVDNASNQAKKSAENIKKSLTDVEKEAKSLSKAQQKEAKATAKAQQDAAKAAAKVQKEEAKAAAKAAQEEAKRTDQVRKQLSTKAEMYSKRLSQAQNTLGVRTEKEIQREIRRTQQSYQLLAQSGSASAKDLSRAWAAQKKQIKELNAEMGKMSTGQKIGAVGKGIAGVAAGIGVGATLAARPIKTTADYNLAVAHLANTAYSDQGNTGKKAGMETIHNVIKNSVTQYGGSKETAMEALGSLVSQGKVSVDSALSLLPTIQKNAMATDSSTTDIAGLVNAGLEYGIQESEIQDFLDYAIVAGKAGGFELRDMAQYAPQLFAKAKGAGLEGMDGAKELFKMLQQIFNVSGGSSETATNTMNFLSKLNSQDTIKRAEKIDYVDPKDGKTKGIKLEESMANYMKKGQSSVEAFLSIVDDVLVNDTGYQDLQKQLAKAQGDSEKKAVLDRIANYMEGTIVGQLVADQQAWLGMYGLRSQKRTGDNVEKGYETAIGEMDRDAEFILEQGAIKFQNAANAAEMAKIEGFQGITDFTADIAGKLAKYGAEYPALTSALINGTEAVKILGGAALATAGSLALAGGFKLPSILTKTTKSVPSAIASGAGTKTAQTGVKAAAGVGRGAGIVSQSKNLFSAPTIALTGLAIAAENRTDYAAQQEAQKEQRADAEQQFYQKNAGNSKPKTDYWSGYVPPKTDAKKQAEINRVQAGQAVAYGGYGLQQDNEIAAARLQQGTLTQEQYQQRVDRNEQRLAGWQSTVRGDRDKAYSGLSGVLSQAATTQDINIEQPTITLSNSKQNYSGLEAAIGQRDLRLKSVESSLDSYQADFQAFGQTISEGLKQAIAGQEHIIKNLITVELDGRIVAENTSEAVYQYAKRG